MNTPGITLSGDCAPWYVDVSCPPYSVTTAMTAEDQRKGIQQAWDDVSAAGGGVVVLPDMYTVDRKQGTFYCLLARDNVATWGIDQFSSGLSMVHAAAGPGEYVFSNNTVLGPPDGKVVALYHRATRRNKSASIRGNIVRQCIVGFQLVSAATDRFERVVLDGNTFDPGPLPASFALVLDRKENVIDDFVMANNIWTGVGVVPVARLLKDEIFVPYDGSQLWRTDGNAGIQATYSCLGSPLGQFDAPIGSLAVRRDGGIGTSLYVKEADTQAGWSAK